MPSEVSSLLQTGDTARDAGDLEGALAIYRQVAEGTVGKASGHFKIGTVYSRMEREEDAEHAYAEALRLQPGYPQAANNLALLYSKRRDFAGAESLFRDLLAEEPDYFEAHINLGNILVDTGRAVEAHYHFRRTLTLSPQSALAHDRLGVALRSRRRVAEAVGFAQQAVALDAAFYVAWNNLGTCHFALGNHAEAEVAFRTSLDLHTDQAEAWSNWLFLSNFQSLPRAEIAARHRRYGQHLRQISGPLPEPTLLPTSAAARRLRLGFVSGDFRRHSVAYFVKDALQSIDRKAFELFAYSTYDTEDHVTESLHPIFDGWRELTGRPDDDAFKIIQDDQIDILVDLSGHTAHNRMPLFCRKPAPLQVSWIGYPNTTGLDCMDYRLTDEIVDPDRTEDALYTEKLFRLPGSFLCFSPPVEAEYLSPARRTQQRDFITFGSFNARVKLGDECIELWSKVLQAVPKSRLIIKSYNGVDDEASRAALIERFVTHGIDPERVEVFGPVQQIEDHLDAYAGIDIALDAYPYNGTTTTCEALWMGVPLITLAGDRHASRVGMALLTRMGLARWVAHSHGEFVANAVRLASDREQLMQLQHTLRARMRASELLDGVAMGRQLGQAFRSMWVALCEKQQATTDNDGLHDFDLARLQQLMGTTRHEELAAEATRLLAVTPGRPIALKALAAALIALGRIEAAYPVAQESARALPNDPEAIGNLGIVAARLKHWQEARNSFSLAAGLAPGDPELADRLATSDLLLGEPAKADLEFARSVALDPDRLDAWNGWLFASNFYSLDRREVFDRHRRFGKQVRSICGPLDRMGASNDEAGRKLRIGFLSGDLGQHSVAYFLQGPLQALDPVAFELFAYSSAHFSDPLAGRLKSLFKQWRDVDVAAARQTAELIRGDGIDVLFDLAGHTANNGLQVCGYRPAPVQVSWIGYPNTTGLDCIDYRITDEVVDPESEDDIYYTEKLVRLERPFLCYTPSDNAPEVGPLPFEKNGFWTFGSLNTRAKLAEETIQLWAAVLIRLPDSRLIIKSYSGLDEAAARDDLRARFARCDIDPLRIDVRASSASMAEHLAVYREIDIGLDTYPYNGTTTSCEALWMGVPIISLAGDRHASRVGGMLLQQVGLDSLVVRASEDFASVALILVAKPDLLADIRFSLRKRMASSALMDLASMGSHLGNTIRNLWAGHCVASDEDRASIVNYLPESVPSKDARGAVAEAKNASGKQANRNVNRKRLDPDSIALMKLVEAQRHEDAERLARRLLARRPDHQLAVRALSASLIGRCEFDKALPILQRGVRRSPKDPELLNNLGIVLSALAQWREAVSAFQAALAIVPEDPEIHRNLGLAYFRSNHWAEAVPPLLKAIELYPGDFVDAVGVLALTLVNDNRIDEAMVCAEELIKNYPDHTAARYLYIKGALHQCNWTKLAASIESVWNTVDTGPFNFDEPSLVLSTPGANNERIRAVSHNYATRYFGGLRGTKALPALPLAGRRLRVGYMSGDFRDHPIGYMLPKVIENHDRGRVETWGFSMCKDGASEVRGRFARAFEHFVDLEKVGAGDTASRIRAAEIDILVDLSGWTVHGQPEALALRCAPIQVNWLGYPGTMGLEALADYILADSIVLPMEHAGAYSETVAHMPHSYMPVDPWKNEIPSSSRLREGLPADGVVFCSFNSCYKFNPAVFDLWSRLLRDVPGSVLWLSSVRQSVEANLRREVQDRGIDAERIVTARFAKSRSDHLARLQLADIALDPFPYNSHSTGVEILQAGVPMISLLGETFAGRVGASLLHAADLADLVVPTLDDYYGLAFRLATSPAELAQVRGRVNWARQNSPLVDMESFSRALEGVYCRMWSDTCAGIRKPLTAE